MKSLLVIAMTLVSVSAFAEHHEGSKDAHKAAMEACKSHMKDKKAMEACMTEHAKVAPAAAEVSAPVPAPKK